MSTDQSTKPQADSPLAALEPVVVIAYADHGVRVLFGTKRIDDVQRDAVIAYLDEHLGSSFSMEGSKTGERFTFSGATRLYTGDKEFQALVKEKVNPAFKHTGTLSMEVKRHNRKMIGVECVLMVTTRGIRPEPLPELDPPPPEIFEPLPEGDKTVVFTLRNPTRSDEELIESALRVAKAYGVYVEQPPRKVSDPDPRARLYRQFRYEEPEEDD